MSKPVLKPHSYYMSQALKEAQKAAAFDEVPIGCVIVDSAGAIMARAYNKTERAHTQLAHAELLALAKASKKRKDWRLDDCWLYVTLEPCLMCIQAVQISRLAGIVYGAASPIYGGIQKLDSKNAIPLYKNRPTELEIIRGIESEKAATLLKQFFKKKRKVRERSKKRTQSKKSFES